MGSHATGQVLWAHDGGCLGTLNYRSPVSQLASIHGTGVKADVRGRGRTEWPFGGPIGTVNTRKICHFTGF